MSLGKVEQVRLLIGDRGDDLIFTGAEIEGYLQLGRQNIFLAGAYAARALAGSAALLARAERIGDHSIDNRGRASAYLELAEKLQDEAQRPALAVMEVSSSDANALQIWYNDVMRRFV